MGRFEGDAVVKRIACGPVFVIKRKAEWKEETVLCDPEKEWERVRHACTRTIHQLENLSEEVRASLGEKAADIFEAHRMILLDEEFNESVRDMLIQDGVSGEVAVIRTGMKFSEMFAAMDMEYMRARAADIRDITGRVIQNMMDEENELIRQIKEEGPVILMAENMNPSDIFRFGRESVLAIVTTQGSVTSHAAIMARSMNIPTLIHVAGLDLEQIVNGTTVLVDAAQNLLITDPTEEELQEARERQRVQKQEDEMLRGYADVKSYRKDGKQIEVCANITDISEVELMQQAGGDGVGLYRSEFLFMDKQDFPTEEEQLASYVALVRKVNGKRLVIRTMDIGSDKPLSYFPLEPEENPALGCRGIRVSLRYPEIFKVQLRALFRAAAYGNLEIVYPMITAAEELDDIQKIIDEAVLELEEQELTYRIPRQGIMIETPVAVMISEELAQRVDFFSIGTNDLAQYAIAIDRQNTSLNMMHNPQHEGILRMINMTIQAAHRHGISAGICGEMAMDETLVRRFVGMGVDGLSVATSQILKLRKIIHEL